MADSATISILLNAGGNLGTVVDGATGKVVALGKAAKGAHTETARAQQGIAAMGEQAARAFGEAGSSLAKFAGPLGALGGISAVAGLAIGQAVDLAREKFARLIEEPVKLAEAIRDAAKAADELAKARDAKVAADVGKLGPVAEPLIARGGERLLGLARQLSSDTGVPLDDVAKAVQAGNEAGMQDDAIRSLVAGAKMVQQSGHMTFADAVKTGLGNAATPALDPTVVAAGVVNTAPFIDYMKDPKLAEGFDREFRDHALKQAADRAAWDKKRQAEYDQAQVFWNATGQIGEPPRMGPEFQETPFAFSMKFKPKVTAADFAAMGDNLKASPIIQALEGQRTDAAQRTDLDIRDIETRGVGVVSAAESAAQVDRTHPGLRSFTEADGKLAGDEQVARKRAEAWDFLGPFNYHWNDVARISDERKRRTLAVQTASPETFAGMADAGQSPDRYLADVDARIAADRGAKRQTAGLPVSDAGGRIEALLGEIARNTAADPLRPAQTGE